MTHADPDRLLRFLDGTLPPDEAAAVQAALDASPELRQELATLQAVRGTLRQNLPDAPLQPFFADRLMRRLAPAPTRMSESEEFFGALVRLFRPVAVAGALLVLGIGAYNVSLADDYEAEASATEAVLALPPVSLATAYDVDYTAR